jgi:serine protease Do
MKIKETLNRTKSATFAVTLPNPQQSDFPTPVGTGFLISPDGWFVTAAHVLTVFDKVRRDPASCITAMKEMRYKENQKTPTSELITGIELKHFDPQNDFALLKAEFSENSDKEWLEGSNGFPFVPVANGILEDGDEVYSFGYPLSRGGLTYPGPEILVGGMELHPRVTSAIVASRYEKVGKMIHSGPQQTYVLDKALNYGNSGGPIIATDSGTVYAFCSRFQPVFVPQPQLRGDVNVMIPSLYGVVTSFSFPPVRDALLEQGVRIGQDLQYLGS